MKAYEECIHNFTLGGEWSSSGPIPSGIRWMGEWAGPINGLNEVEIFHMLIN
jgi:hypothetical protein